MRYLSMREYMEKAEGHGSTPTGPVLEYKSVYNLSIFRATKSVESVCCRSVCALSVAPCLTPGIFSQAPMYSEIRDYLMNPNIRSRQS